jgi:hypothetical protein
LSICQGGRGNCQLKIKSALFLEDLKIKSALISGLLLKELENMKK